MSNLRLLLVENGVVIREFDIPKSILKSLQADNDIQTVYTGWSLGWGALSSTREKNKLMTDKFDSDAGLISITLKNKVSDDSDGFLPYMTTKEQRS